MDISIDSKSLEVMRTIEKFHEQYDPALQVFSEYIASNPNFKYNITYLTDHIEEFHLQLTEILARETSCLAFWKDYIAVIEAKWPDELWMLVQDNLFVLLSGQNEKVFTISELLNSNKHFLLGKFQEILEQRFSFSLHEFDRKHIKAMLFVETKSGVQEFTEIRQLD